MSTLMGVLSFGLSVFLVATIMPSVRVRSFTTALVVFTAF